MIKFGTWLIEARAAKHERAMLRSAHRIVASGPAIVDPVNEPQCFEIAPLQMMKACLFSDHSEIERNNNQWRHAAIQIERRR
jgi:hypothetical protein